MNPCAPQRRPRRHAFAVRWIWIALLRLLKSGQKAGPGKAVNIRGCRSAKARPFITGIGEAFQPVARFTTSLIKLVPTQWGAPTFEIDGIKMLPTAKLSPFEDAQRKVALIQPRGKTILDTCGGLGYFAHWCLQGLARQVLSYEKNPDVL